MNADATIISLLVIALTSLGVVLFAPIRYMRPSGIVFTVAVVAMLIYSRIRGG